MHKAGGRNFFFFVVVKFTILTFLPVSAVTLNVHVIV